MVVERVVVNSVPAAMEVMREVEEGEAAIQEGRQVFELLHHDACGRGGGRLLPTSAASTAHEHQAAESTSVPSRLPHSIVFIRSSSPSLSLGQIFGACTVAACCPLSLP